MFNASVIGYTTHRKVSFLCYQGTRTWFIDKRGDFFVWLNGEWNVKTCALLRVKVRDVPFEVRKAAMEAQND